MPDSAASPRPKTAQLPARGLRRATLALFSASDDPVRDRHRLSGPLSQAVAWHKTRPGQRLCADLARALAAGNFPAAVELCGKLVELEARESEAQDRASQQTGKFI